MKTSRESGGIAICYTRVDGSKTMNCLSLGWLQVFDTEDEARVVAEEAIKEYGPESSFGKSGYFSALNSYTFIKVPKGARMMNEYEIRIHELQIALFRAREEGKRMREERDHYRARCYPGLKGEAK